MFFYWFEDSFYYKFIIFQYYIDKIFIQLRNIYVIYYRYNILINFRF